VAPALLLSRADGSETLKDAGRGTSAGRSTRMRQTLVIAEVALSLVLLASAGLLGRTLVALQHVDPGFVRGPCHRRRGHAAESAVSRHRRAGRLLPASPRGDADDARHRVERRDETLPLSGNNMGLGFTIDGRPSDPGHKLSASYFAISPDYFTAMGIRLTRGARSRSVITRTPRKS